MKILLFTLLLCAVPASAQTVESRYDKFKDQTLYLVRPFSVYKDDSQTLTVALAAAHQGEQHKTPESVALFFTSRAGDWLYLRETEVRAIVNGERLILGVARPEKRKTDYTRNSRYSRSGVFVEEMFRLDVPVGVFMKLANGESVEMQVGPAEFKLEKDQKSVFQQFGNRIAP